MDIIAALWEANLLSVPKDIQNIIIGFLAPYDLFVLRCICKYFRIIIGTRYIKKAKEIIRSLTQYGSVSLVRWALCILQKQYGSAVYGAAFYGQIDIFEQYAHHGDMGRVYAEAVMGGQIGFYQYLVAKYKPNGCCLRPSEARYYTDIVCVYSESSQRKGSYDTVLALAAREGRLKMLQYLCETAGIFQWDVVVANAARGSHLHCLEYLHTIYNRQTVLSRSEHYILSDIITYDKAPSLQCLQFLVETFHCYVSHTRAIELYCHMARQGLLGHLQYLHDMCKIPLTAEVMEVALENGHMNCVIYIHSKGIEIDDNDDYGMQAAKSGNVECLRYIHQNGGELTDYCVFYAAQAGSLACLKYLHDNGVSFRSIETDTPITSAAKVGSLECLRYLHENGAPMCYLEALHAAVVHSRNRDCISYVLQQRHQQSVFDDDSNEVKILEGAVSYECDDDSLELLKLLHKNGRLELDHPTVLASAAAAGNIKCVSYLLENDCHGKGDLLIFDVEGYRRQQNYKKKKKREIVPF